MSKRNGDKARVNREQKKKALRRKHNRKLPGASESRITTPDVLIPASAESPFITSQLRRLPGESKDDPTALEIVVFKSPKGRPNN
jgi:hypothetical protein